MTGGVGESERIEMEKTADDYNLKIVLATASGRYLADLMVLIEDENSRIVLQTMAKGPWLYADLPAGTYKVSVAHEHEARNRTVHIGSGDGLKTVVLTWKME
jgi:hypothetical protein